MDLQLDDYVFARVNPMQFASEDYKSKAVQQVKTWLQLQLQLSGELFMFLLFGSKCVGTFAFFLPLQFHLLILFSSKHSQKMFLQDRSAPQAPLWVEK